MGFFDKKIQQAQDETEKLINTYAGSLKASTEVASIKTMVSAGASATTIADRGANVHKTLFSTVMAAAPPKLLKDPRRVAIIEQFCLSLWGKILGIAAYQELLNKLKQPIPKRMG